MGLKRAIRDWPDDEKPRERLIRLGPQALSDTELLAILISSGDPRSGNAKELAMDLIHRFSGIAGIDRAGLRAIQETTGVGPAKACRLKAAFELARRIAFLETLSAIYKDGRVGPIDSRVSAALYRARTGRAAFEQALVILLDARRYIITDRLVALGSRDESVLSPSQVIAPALEAGAPNVVIVHGHPNGESAPSEEDRRTTLYIRKACLSTGIDLVDHVVVGEHGHFSFREEGLL